MLKSLKPVETPSNFTNQQPSGVPTFPPDVISIKKTSHVPSSGPRYQTSGSLSVAIRFIPSLCQVLHKQHLFQILQGIKPVTRQAIIRYRLQLVWQVWFHIFNLVNSQLMFQVYTQAVDKFMGLLIFQSRILASTLVYHYHKTHTIPPMPIYPPFFYFSPFHLTISFESTDNSVSTNDVSSVTIVLEWIFKKLFSKRVHISTHCCLIRRKHKAPSPIIQKCIIYSVIERNYCFPTLNTFGNFITWSLHICSIFRLVQENLMDIFQYISSKNTTDIILPDSGWTCFSWLLYQERWWYIYQINNSWWDSWHYFYYYGWW